MSPSSEPILDPAVMDELRELGRELEQDVLGEVVAAFRKRAPELLGEMEAAEARGDWSSLARAAHTLKGGSAQIGARALSTLARGVETAAKAGQGEGLAALVAECRAAHLATDAALGDAVKEAP